MNDMNNKFHNINDMNNINYMNNFSLLSVSDKFICKYISFWFSASILRFSKLLIT